MRLLNHSSSPKYSKAANTTVKPGKATRELDLFQTAIEDFLKATKGFTVLLSDKDISLLADLCAKYLLPNIDTVDIPDLVAAEQLKETLRDPDGIKKIEDRAHELKQKIQEYRSKIIKENEARENHIKSESNFIGPDGNPVATVQSLSNSKEEEIKPVLHNDMPSDLKSILENNLAVMTDASGRPFKNNIVATPGGTPVSTNPKDYQGVRNVPAGQPDFSDLKANQPNN